MTIGEERAWAAGLFEGEGSIITTSDCARLVLTMTDLDVVERFAAITGFGTIIHEAPKPNRKQLYRWSIAKLEEVSEVLGWMTPLLGQRRRGRASEAITVLEGITARRSVRKEKSLASAYASLQLLKADSDSTDVCRLAHEGNCGGKRGARGLCGRHYTRHHTRAKRAYPDDVYFSVDRRFKASTT